MKFEDHFSQLAEKYAQFRPRYSPGLYAYLARQTPGHELAWDCGTGSGQAALDLAQYYDRVVATDASAEQISQAVTHERITYRVEPAEETELASGSVDLVTVAIAVHWFDLDRFYAEVRRVMKKDGVIAVWTYHRPVIDPDVDAQIIRLEDEILAGFWPEQIRYLREHYRTLPFPFEELDPPEFDIRADWTLDQMLGFISSWSASRKYEKERGHHPLQPIWDEFAAAWGDEEQPRPIRWPLYLRVGRVHS